MRILALLTAVFLTFPAWAQDKNVPPPAICLLTSEYNPSDDVAYRPGVDVNGDPVTRADLGMMPFGQADIVSVPLTVDLAQRIRENLAEYEGVEMQAPLGTLDIQMDGRITFNGQDWTSEVRHFCSNPAQWPDGHAPADVIQSEPEIQAPPEEKPPVEPKPPVQQVVAPVSPPVPAKVPAAPSPEQVVEPEAALVPKPEPVMEEESPGKLLEGGESREEGYR